MVSILLVDDEADWQDSIGRTLCKYNITSKDKLFKVEDGASAMKFLANCSVDLIMLDLFLKNETGEELLKEIIRMNPMQNVVMMTSSDSVKHAVNCIKLGAKDYLIKSTPVAELMDNINRLIKIIKLESENAKIKSQFTAKDSYSEFVEYITCSPQVISLFGYIKAISKSSQHILITGESGVGKGIFAKIIAKTVRPGKPFLSVNIAGYDSLMFSDTLFGHIKGAFTGADSNRQGMIQQGADGVIFLDEIGDLSLQSQVKLLYLIQDREYQQLGSDKILKTNAKFIFATNQNLQEKLKDKSLRNDLFFRLNTHCVNIPPLRERPEDIPLLITYFAKLAANDFKKNVPVFTDNFMERIKKMQFPGNIRQLRSIIYDLVARCDDIIDAKQLANIKNYIDEVETDKILTSSIFDEKLPTVDEMTNILVKKAMDKAGGNQIKAAKLLGISQPTLSRRLRDKN